MPDTAQQHNGPDERTPSTADDTLYARLCDWARLRPAAPCLSEADSGARLTYGEYVAAIGQMQRALGAAPRRIALALPGSLANAVVWASALTGGHALLPLAPDAPPHEVWSHCQQFQPDTFIVERRADAPAQAPAEARILTHADCDALIRAGVAAAAGAASQAQPAAEAWTPAPDMPGVVCLFTSGSTGEPKRVELSATQITCAADQIRRSHQLTPTDRGLTALPFFHINAPVVSLCASLLAGASLTIAPRFSVSHFWEWIERERITWVSIVPTILALLLETEPPAFLPGALRFVRTASAPLAPAHLLRFEQRFGVPVIETYGLTEAASQVCANPLPPLRHKPGSVGLPVGVNLRICALRGSADAADDANASPLREVERGTVGEVCVTGPSVISAYAGRAGADAFQDGWFRTGDLGYKDADGYVYLTGRLRDVIIRGGENVAPREVEETLLAHASIAECAVIGAPDPLYGEQVVAFLTTRARWTRALEAQLQALCAERLSPHKRPAALVALRALPRTTSGKIDRPGLRQLWARQEALCAPVGQASAARAG